MIWKLRKAANTRPLETRVPPLAERSDQPYELRKERMVLSLRQEDLHRPSVMNRDIQVCAFADDPAQLQKPRICQVMTIA